MSDGIPFVAIGHGEEPPWAGLPLDCPECGEGPLELQASTSDTGRLTLRYISHCGQAWMRGPMTLEEP